MPETTLRIVGLSIGPPTIRAGGPIIVTIAFSEAATGSIRFSVSVDSVPIGDPVVITDPEDDRAQVTRTLPADLGIGEHRLQLVSIGGTGRVIAGRDFVVAVGSNSEVAAQDPPRAGGGGGMIRWAVILLALLTVGGFALFVARRLGRRSMRSAPGPGTMAASVTSATWARQHKRRRRRRL